jgi:hypothetical protein
MYKSTWEQGCQIFLDTKYQNGKKYTKLPRTIPNVPKIEQITVNGPSVHKKNHHLPLQDTPKFTQNCIFGLKTNHLATLRGNYVVNPNAKLPTVKTCSSKSSKC